MRKLICVGCAIVAFGVAHGAAAHGVKPSASPVPKAEQKVERDPWSIFFNPAEAAARISIKRDEGWRYIRSDGLPDHQPGSFPNHGNPHAIEKKDYEFRVSLRPTRDSQPTRLGHENFGVALNGVPFDPLTAEFWNRDRSSGWNVEAMSGAMNLGLDRHNAHVQPDGSYHYHALPTGLHERLPYRTQPVLLGYAADGFPIYGPYGYQDAADATSSLTELRASYQIKKGQRPDDAPGGVYNGTYVQDYEYVSGIGQLDECNGREGVTPEYPSGTYYYVISLSFPFIPRCWWGSPDSTFFRGRPSGGMGGGMGAGPDGRGHDQMGGPPRRAGFSGGGRRPPGGRPDLGAAAERLGISKDELRRALGPPPPNFERTARKLGISADQLYKALHP